MNTDDNVTLEGAPVFPRQPNTANIVGISSNEELDQFPSESEAFFDPAPTVPTLPLLPPETATGDLRPVPYVIHDSHYGRVLLTGTVGVLLGLMVNGFLLRTLSGGNQTFSAPPAEVVGGQAASKPADSRRVVRALPLPVDDAAAGVVRNKPDAVAIPAPLKPATRVRQPRSSVSRTGRRESVGTRVSATQPTHGAQLSRGTAGVATPPPRAAAPAPAAIADNRVDEQRGAPNQELARTERQAPAMGPALTARESAAAPGSAQVSASTSNSDTDELTFRWSAPVGTFADPTASQTRFFCPETPQEVAITVLVTDGKGGAGSDRITVHCVASTSTR